MPVHEGRPRRQDWRQLDLVLAYLIHPSVHPADVDNYCGPDTGAGINSTGVLPSERGLWRQTRMYFEGCSRLPPGVIFAGSLRVGPSWLLRSGSCESPEHKAKCHCCWSHARYLSQGNVKQGSNSKPLLTTCLELLFGYTHEWLTSSIFLEPFQSKWKHLVFFSYCLNLI